MFNDLGVGADRALLLGFVDMKERFVDHVCVLEIPFFSFFFETVFLSQD